MTGILNRMYVSAKRFPSALVKTPVNSPISGSSSRFSRPYKTIVSEKSPSDCPSPSARRQSPRFSMSACFDSSTSTSRGFVFVVSLPICETKPVFDILKWRRRLFTSLRALSVGSGVHSMQTMKLAGIFNSASRTKGRVSVMASFIDSMRTTCSPTRR